MVRVTEETWYKDAFGGIDLNANVLILSYNRPRMLSEAIDSVRSQSYGKSTIYIVDDGSDFDVEGLVKKYNDDRIILAQSPRIPMEQRLIESRIGRNLNSVIAKIAPVEPVFYLCDDDIMAPDWLGRATIAFAANPQTHVCQGEFWSFNDGQDPVKDSVYGMQVENGTTVPTMFWSTGSFAHRAFCSQYENVWWTDNTYLHSQDTNFIEEIWKKHFTYSAIPAPAVYRREHSNTLSEKLGRKNDDGKYISGYVPPKANEGMLDVLE